MSLDPSAMGEYGDLIIDKNVLYNFCERMCRNSELITIAGENVIRSYDDVIFEGAQGLILDEENNAFAPNLTSSRTGLTNPDAMLSWLGINEPCEAVYVTRTYVTKHGAGRFPYEEIFLAQGRVFADETNIRNEWQGSLRFAPHGNEDEFNEYVIRDVEGSFFSPSVMFTHVDETDGKVLTVDGDVLLDEWVGKVNKGGLYRKVYVSASHFAEDITLMK